MNKFTYQQKHGYFGGAIQTEVAPTIDSCINYQHTVVGEIMDDVYDKSLNQTPKDCNIRIRKLTPKECWRLMDFDDKDYEAAQKVCSNTQLYKQAGNSICVNVLYEIFKQML